MSQASFRQSCGPDQRKSFQQIQNQDKHRRVVWLEARTIPRRFHGLTGCRNFHHVFLEYETTQIFRIISRRLKILWESDEAKIKRKNRSSSIYQKVIELYFNCEVLSVLDHTGSNRWPRWSNQCKHTCSRSRLTITLICESGNEYSVVERRLSI